MEVSESGASREVNSPATEAAIQQQSKPPMIKDSDVDILHKMDEGKIWKIKEELKELEINKNEETSVKEETADNNNEEGKSLEEINSQRIKKIAVLKKLDQLSNDLNKIDIILKKLNKECSKKDPELLQLAIKELKSLHKSVLHANNLIEPQIIKKIMECDERIHNHKESLLLANKFYLSNFHDEILEALITCDSLLNLGNSIPVKDKKKRDQFNMYIKQIKYGLSLQVRRKEKYDYELLADLPNLNNLINEKNFDKKTLSEYLKKKIKQFENHLGLMKKFASSEKKKLNDEAGTSSGGGKKSGSLVKLKE